MAEKKIAVVTGATGALGGSVTRELLEHGIHVIITYRTAESLSALEDELGDLSSEIEPHRVDVTDEKEVDGLFEAVKRDHGRVDILVNNVGAYSGGKEIWETTAKEWDDMMTINLRSAFLCCRAALPMMIQNNYGKIVNIAARPAIERRYRAKSGAYSVSKAGVLVLTETIAEEVKKLDINVNAVLPSTIDTLDNRRAMPQADFSRWVKPGEIATVIMGLVSDYMRPVSGSAVTVYGKA
jgi:NAD(P)-dependent dehydrogenase (short-subunit alcohol dehydrogenase family)